ncbi:MAG TPA: hypothetical protein PK069_02610 [Methanolinea sp.]|nr:hypothetical protein [Methanolinea sp.]HQK56576.1 hypothetical protein [Methanolinea sp.]
MQAFGIFIGLRADCVDECMSTLSYFTHSDKGLRERNEDACLAMEKDSICIFAVAEGMGGPSTGPSAAEVAVNSLREGGGGCHGSLVEIAESLLACADEALFHFQNASPESDPPAVAVTIALVGPAGECLVSSPGQRKVFFMPHAPLGGTGPETGDEPVEPVLHDPGAGMHEAILPPGFLILCSDGISQFVEEARIYGIVKERGDDLEDACRKLVYEAFQNGSNDNLTVVLVRQPGT